MKTFLKPVLLIGFLIVNVFVISGQIHLYSKNYRGKHKVGKYLSKSTDTFQLCVIKDTIQPQISQYFHDSNMAFVFPPSQGILLFNVKGATMATKLLSPCLIRIDTIFYNNIYQSEISSFFTFDVWYAVTINGKRYYMDFKPHDFRAFQLPLADFDQVFAIYAQSTGYDDIYNFGYPNYFHVVVFSNKDSCTTINYTSKELLFVYNNEYWELPESLKYKYSQDRKELEFEMFGRANYKATWNGKSLIRIK